MEKEEWEMEKTLENVVTGPYGFVLKDGTKLYLDEWTIGAERWAKKNFGSLEELFNKLLAIKGDGEDVVDAAVRVAIYKLTDESRRTVDEMRGEKTSEQFFEDMLTYAQLSKLCKAEYEMIRDSMPLEIVEKLKKNRTNLNMALAPANRATQRANSKKIRSKKKRQKK